MARLGHAPARARQPRQPGHGHESAVALAPRAGRRPAGHHRVGPLDRSGPLAGIDRRATGRAPGERTGPRRVHRVARALRLSPREPGRAPRRVRRSRRHRRPLAGAGSRADSSRLLRRRGRATDVIRHRQPAFAARPRRSAGGPGARMAVNSRRASTRRTDDRSRAVGSIDLRPTGHGPAFRRNGGLDAPLRGRPAHAAR